MQFDEWQRHGQWLKTYAESYREPIFLALLLRTEGSTLRKAGAASWFHAESASGVLSGGCMEKALYRAAEEMLSIGIKSQIVAFDSRDPNDAWLGYGKGCPGAATILLQQMSPADLTLFQHFTTSREASPLSLTMNSWTEGPVIAQWSSTSQPSRWELWNGHKGPMLWQRAAPKRLILLARHPDALALMCLAQSFGWHVTMLAGVGSDTIFTAADRCLSLDDVPDTFWDSIATPERTAILSMSHKFEDDVAMLQATQTQPWLYRGVMGGTLKHHLLTRELVYSGRSLLHCPVGNPRGLDTPGGIALSVMAELESLVAPTDAQSLWEAHV